MNAPAGPSTTNAIVGKAFAGQVVNIIGCNADCSWYQLADTKWIAAFLVKMNGTPTPAPKPTFTPPPSPPPTPDCDASYPGVCIPPAPPDLDCGDITFRRFTVVGADPHGFDGDNDGIGCESNLSIASHSNRQG